MSRTVSAGLLMYQQDERGLRVFLVHPGGPYFSRRDAGVWSIPKGLPESGEALLETAVREFAEETGITPTEPFTPLDRVVQKGGKVVHAWAFEGRWDPADGFVSNRFEIEWPPRSGRRQSFPEVDRAELFTPDIAREKMNIAQAEFVDRLETWLVEQGG